MPNGTVCQLVKLPLVVGEQVASINVDNVTCPDEQAKKIDHIDVVVRDLEADPVYTSPTSQGQGVCNSPKATVHFGAPDCNNQPREIRKVNVSGTLHMQIYYVNRDDNVRHMGVDVDFTKSVDINPPIIVMEPQNVDISFRDVDVNASFELPRPTRIHTMADITFTLKVVEQTQLWVTTCTSTEGATLGIQEESFENFTGNLPSNWEGTNVGPNPNGRTGQAAQLGVCTTRPATLARTFTDVGPGDYQLTFWARSIDVPRDPCDFALQVTVQFLGNGVVLNSAQQTISSQQLNNTYRQFTLAATAPAGTTSALIGFQFTPQAWNTCSALIDDLTFGLTGA